MFRLARLAPRLQPRSVGGKGPWRTFFQSHQPLRQRYEYRRFNQPYSRFQQSANVFARWAARPTFYYEVGGLGAIVGGLYVFNLETVPVSGRRRFNIISASMEESTAKEMYAQVMQQYRGRILPHWDRRSQMVQRVLERLIPSSGLSAAGWEVHVIDSPEKNAFVIPGGKVFIFTGILPICATEDGVAAVLSHEIAHNVAHHSAERMSSSFIIAGIATVAQFFLGLPDFASGTLLNLAFMMPGSRQQEAEADYIGLMMMAQSCYNPEAAAHLWKRMEEMEKTEVPELLSTHPSHHNRMEKIMEWLPEAENKRADSDCSSTLDYAKQFHKVFPQIRW